MFSPIVSFFFLSFVIAFVSQNALLQETCEEWEQCEKKLKDIRTWMDKTKTTLESPQHKKKPLRDQLGLCEKLIADISIQRTKITLSVEKLQVIFTGIISFKQIRLLLILQSNIHKRTYSKYFFFISFPFLPFYSNLHYTKNQYQNQWIWTK